MMVIRTPGVTIGDSPRDSAGRRGTADVPREVGRGEMRDSPKDSAGQWMHRYKWDAGKRGTVHCGQRGTPRDSRFTNKNGARENAGQSAGHRGTADVPIKIGRGKARDSPRDSAGQRGTADVPIKMGRGNLTPFGVLNI